MERGTYGTSEGQPTKQMIILVERRVEKLEDKWGRSSQVHQAEAGEESDKVLELVKTNGESRGERLG
jgi:hypothetical protein